MWIPKDADDTAVDLELVGGGRGTRRGVGLLFGGRGGVGSLYNDIVFGRVDVVYILAVFGCMEVRVCFLLRAGISPFLRGRAVH